MQSSAQLNDLLSRIHRRSYPAYKDTRGAYQFPGYVLSIDHVQGDPFAAPSRLSIHLTGKQAGFPKQLYAMPCQRIALQDAITRRFAALARRASGQARGSGHSGLLSLSHCGQEVLERSACQLNPADGSLTLRLEVGFPANGRTINSPELVKILFDLLPGCVSQALCYRSWKPDTLQAVADLAEDQQFIRETLPKLGLCAFVADGSILPRASGISSLPMEGAIPFQSPPERAVTLTLPHRGTITGMGIPRGITLIVGGGYHGKSTLLNALERGVYNHIAGDGRELVITDASAVKIRAEDGRCVHPTDISLFINHLPNGKDTTRFSTQDASGSTSQAASVVEALEAGAGLLLMDEDTSATNFMVRDALMQQVIHRDQEPITPFLERVEELFQRHGLSTILVAGSSGAYFHPAHHIIQMDQYRPRDITARAKEAAAQFPLAAPPLAPAPLPHFDRCPRPSRELSGDQRIKRKTLGRDGILLNRETIDLGCVEQIVDSEQCTALGCCLVYAHRHLLDGKHTLTQIIDQLEQLMDQKGLSALSDSPSHVDFMARPRRQELFACFCRFRSLG